MQYLARYTSFQEAALAAADLLLNLLRTGSHFNFNLKIHTTKLAAYSFT
jgi:hypothetical protein